ncbi:Fusarisetin A cluster transcription factor fsa6, partial [Lachnellula arida]
ANEKTNGHANGNDSINWEDEDDTHSQSVLPTTLEGTSEPPKPPYAKSRTDFTFGSDKVTGQNDIRAGTMKSNAAGDVQYEYRGSQWAAVLINTSITALPLEGEDENEHHSGLGVPFLESSTLSIEDLLFHILHEPTFHAQYEAFLQNPYEARPSWLAVLFVILSLAITSLASNDSFLDDFRFAPGSDPYANIRALSKRYHMLTMKCLEKQGVLWGKHNVQSLQALILLGYAMSHSHEKIWVLLGMTYNVATGLACHVDPSNFDMNLIQCEERRRCWAGLTMLYTIHNVLLGTSDPGRPINTRRVQLPLDANDVDITAEGIVTSSNNGPTQLSYLLFKFQLDDLTASICSEIFDSSTVSKEAISALDQKICLMQESWDARYVTDSNNLPLSVNQKMHLHILHGAIISNQPSQSGTFPVPTPGPLSLLMLEPDHASNNAGSAGNLTDMENSEKLEYLAPRLQPRHWINPYYMAWGEWDEFLPRTSLADSMQ